MKKIIVLFLSIYAQFAVAQNSEMSLIFIGDVMQHMPQIDAAYDSSSKTYNYDSCFVYVKPILQNADVAIANLEITLAGKPYSGYPQFSAPDALAQGLKNAGINYLVTANNHSCDRGKNGIVRTIKVLDSLGIEHTGTFVDSLEREKKNVLLIEKNGIRVAVINYTYGTNGIPIPKPTVVNIIEKEKITSDVVKAKALRPDKIILVVHWGNEYERVPNAFQKDIAKFCFEQGADIVIGSHPHVLQQFEYTQRIDTLDDMKVKENIVVYSLGNYVSNQRDRYKDGGAMVKIVLQKNLVGQTKIKEQGYFLTWVNKAFVNGKYQYYILPASQFENTVGKLDATALEKLKLFTEDSRSLFKEHNKNFTEYKFDFVKNEWRLE